MTEPLGLARGSVRALITLTIIGATIATLFVPIVDDRALQPLLVLCGVVVRDYFATRQDQNRQDGPPLHDPVVNEE